MELIKNIFFNTDKLIPFAKIKISYTGNLFNETSEEVYIRYGFGNDWDNTTNIKMNKTELGFQAEIELTDASSFDFCFYNDKDIWDNNDGKNYSFEIEPIPQTIIEIESNPELLPIINVNKFYIWRKKIYKVVTYLPNLLLGKYKRKLNVNNNEQ